ncbi:MAG: hypothetical protein ABI855_10145 [Bacteroidota bacterium]
MLFSIHQYSHLALAEMSVVSMILIAAMTFVRYRDTGRFFFLMWTFLFLSVSVLLKLQFIYVLIIPSMSLIVESYIDKKPVLSSNLFITILCVVSICLIFFLVWYLPFKTNSEI